MIPLRKCNKCGLEAHTIDDLKKFAKEKSSKYERKNICHKCNKKLHPPKIETRQKWNRKYYLTHKQKCSQIDKNRNSRSFTFLGKQVTLSDNPRTNICSKCGRNYPKDLKKQTHLHHLEYDKNNKLDNTIELCTGCHLTLHRLQKKMGR
jgi:hypothetical protein